MPNQVLASSLLEVTRPEPPRIVRVTAPAIRERQARTLQESLLSIADQTRGMVVLDLSDVQQLTSAGVNAIVQGQDRCRKLDGKLVLVGLNQSLTDLFKVTGLDRILTIVTHESDALRLFKSAKRKRGKAA